MSGKPNHPEMVNATLQPLVKGETGVWLNLKDPFALVALDAYLRAAENDGEYVAICKLARHALNTLPS